MFGKELSSIEKKGERQKEHRRMSQWKNEGKKKERSENLNLES